MRSDAAASREEPSDSWTRTDRRTIVSTAHRLRIMARVLAATLILGWSASSTALADGLDPADEQRCMDAERDLLTTAQELGRGRIVGINDNLLLIDKQRLKVAEFATQHPAAFEEACRTLLAGDPQDELEQIANEIESGGAGDIVWPLVGVLIGGVLTLLGGWLLQRHQQRSARVGVTRGRVLDAVSAGEAWVRVKRQETAATTDVVDAKKAEALAAGATLLSTLSMAKDDPWSVGGGGSQVEPLSNLHSRAEAIFGHEGRIADNEPEAAKQELDSLKAMAPTAVSPPKLLWWRT